MQTTTSVVTSKAEIEKVMLRFMRVTDDTKLAPILAKLLPELIKIYFEQDLAKADITNQKLVQQNELMTHLTNRVENARGGIPVPVAALVDIFACSEYHLCQNQQLKRQATELIFNFLALSLRFAITTIDTVPFATSLLKCMSQPLPILEKARLFIMMAWYFINSAVDVALLQTPLTTYRADFLQMTTLYTITVVADPYGFWKNTLKPIFQGQILGYHSAQSKLTQVQHGSLFDDFLLKTALQNQTLFTAKDVVGVMVLATLDQQACSAGIRYSCDSWLRNQALDLEDRELESLLYSVINQRYAIYSQCIPNCESLIDKPSDMALKYFMTWIMKLETKTQATKKLEIVNHALFHRQEPQIHRQGLLLARQIIREDPNLDSEGAQGLKQALDGVLNLSQFNEESQAFALLLVAELSVNFFELVLGQNISLALQTFEKLKQRINEIKGFKPIREDELCLTYMEALNKLRDCLEVNLKDAEQKELLMSKIVAFLHSQEAASKENSELLYILYLYVARLDKEQLSAPLLLHSINLKEHPDIKIRKEALGQLERFRGKTVKGLLAPFLEQIRLLFLSLENPLLSLLVDNDAQIKKSLQYNSSLSQYGDQSLIDKLVELSEYALNFYMVDRQTSPQLEKLLLLNLNQNFTQIKSDFIAPLKLLKKYLKNVQGKGAQQIVSQDGALFINKCGQNAVNLDQRIIALKLLFVLYKREPLYQPIELDKAAKSHEQRMFQLYSLAQKVYFSNQDQDQFISLTQEITQKNNTPNQIEEQKLLANCFALMNFQESYAPAVDCLLANCLNRQLEAGYKCKVIKCFPAICQEESALSNRILSRLNELLDFDQTQVQSEIGKCLARIWHQQGQLLDKLTELLEKANKAGLELNSKRNLVVYLFEVVDRYAESSSEMREKYFVEIQQIFMRYLFDRRQFMQDLASKGLSLVYRLGNEQQRSLLVTSLSDTFSGNGPQKTKEQDDQQELLLDFSAQTNTEQREKLKTYKDLVRVAEELGQRDLIYQFLEVHRHNQQRQDIKNAAKGISSLLMLDDKIRLSLIKIAPKILLMTYDPNQEVCDTMKQLWSALIPVSEEPTFLVSRWDEIFQSCVKGIKSESWRSRQAACLCLTDLIQAQSRQWKDISKEYRILFLTSLGLLSDDAKDSVKTAAYKLVKALRSFTLKHCNMYSNTDLTQLQEVLDTTIPLVLDDCLNSMLQKVRQFGLHILAELIRSTQSQNLAEKLKINNKYERQLVFNGNSHEVMSKLLCQKGYLQRIIQEMILNVSSFQDKANQQLNYAEQMQADGKLKIDKQELAEISMRYSRESINGEILKRCRALMTHETFDAVLQTLLQIIQKNTYDVMTKQTATGFICDVVLENQEMMSAQNAKKVAQKIVQLFSQQTPTACLQMKESLVGSYASCFGLQFKILKQYPNTVKTLLTTVQELDKDLLLIKQQFFFQLTKYLPAAMLAEPDLGKDFLPHSYIQKFNTQDQKLRKIAEKVWDQYSEQVGGADKLSEMMVSYILTQLLESFDSASYAERISASQAFSQIAKFSKDEDVVRSTTERLLAIITGKFFQGKESIIKSFTQMLQEDLIEIDRSQFLESAISQLQNLNLDQTYRNTLMKAVKQAMPQEPKPALYDLLIEQLQKALGEIVEQSQAALLQESQGRFFDFDERKESEQATLTTAINILELMPSLVLSTNQDRLDSLCKQFYGKTNWMVRRAILTCYLKLSSCVDFGRYLTQQIADCGEKYELNLSLASDITYRTLKAPCSPPVKQAALKIVEMLSAKESEELRRNIDVIRQLAVQE